MTNIIRSGDVKVSIFWGVQDSEGLFNQSYQDNVTYSRKGKTIETEEDYVFTWIEEDFAGGTQERLFAVAIKKDGKRIREVTSCGSIRIVTELHTSGYGEYNIYDSTDGDDFNNVFHNSTRLIELIPDLGLSSDSYSLDYVYEVIDSNANTVYSVLKAYNFQPLQSVSSLD